MDIGNFSLMNDDPVSSQIGSKFGLGLYLIVAASVKLNAECNSAMLGELAGKIGFQPVVPKLTGWKPIPLKNRLQCRDDPKRRRVAKCWRKRCKLNDGSFD